MNPSTSPMKAPRNRSYVTCGIAIYKILLYNTKHRLLPSLTKGGGVLWEIISNKYMSVHIPDFALAKLSMCASTLEASHADKSAQRVMKD